MWKAAIDLKTCLVCMQMKNGNRTEKPLNM